jgi:hypothetical protein
MRWWGTFPGGETGEVNCGGERCKVEDATSSKEKLKGQRGGGWGRKQRWGVEQRKVGWKKSSIKFKNANR